VVAVDGPVASGKSTVALRLAERLDLVLLDTGLLYRALAWLALERGIAPSDGASIAALAPHLKLGSRPAASGRGRVARVLLGGCDVTDELQSERVERVVSEVSRDARVRAALLEPQRAVAAEGAAVVAGRDIGTVIFPDASVKVYLQASAPERARRRLAQRGGGTPAEGERVLDAILQRDRADAGQMKPAADAVVIDTDGLDVDAVVDRIERLVRARWGDNDGGGDH